MGENGPNLIQRIVLEVASKKPVLTGLDATVERLLAVETHLKAIDSLTNKVTSNAAFKRTAAEFTSQIKTKGEQPTETLAKMFGFDPKDVTMFGAKLEAAARESVRKLEQTMAGMAKNTPTGRVSAAYKRVQEQINREMERSYFTSGTAQTLKSPVAAGRLFERYSGAAAQEMGVRGNALRRLVLGQIGGGMTPTAGEMKISAAALKVAGQIVLEIPASQITAKLVGNVGAGGGPPREPGSGKFTGGDGKGPKGPKGRKGSGGGGGGGGAPYNPPANASELERIITTTEDQAHTTITEIEELGKTLATTYNDLGEEVRTRLKISRKSPLLEGLRQRQAEFTGQYKSAAAKLTSGDLLGLSALKEKAAGNLDKMITPELQAALEARQITGPQSKLGAQAMVLRAEANALAQQANAGIQMKAARVQALMATPLDTKSFIDVMFPGERNADTGRMAKYYQRIFGGGNGNAAQQVAAVQAMMTGQMNTKGFIQSTLGPQARPAYQTQAYYQKLFGGNVPPVIAPGMMGGPGGPPMSVPPLIQPPKKPGKGGGPLDKWRDFSPMAMLKNMGVLAGWSLAMQPVAMAKEAIEYGVSKTIELQAQVAKLENVYRGASGAAKELAQNILGVASSQGVEAAATLATGTSWARLGLSRNGILEATKQTAILSNISAGELTQDQAQQYLRTLMAQYKLGVQDLGPLVSTLQTTTNLSGTSQRDILGGMVKAGPMAAAGGMGPAELAAIIAEGAKRSGDTGMQAGNSLRAIFTNLMDPGVREYLHRQFGMEPLNAEGQGRNLSATWGQLYQVYSGASRDRRARLAAQVAGNLRGSRFGVMMESYPEAQREAIEALMHPEAGAKANERMRGTLASSWAGLTSSVMGDLLGSAVGKGGNSPAGMAAETLNLLTNIENVSATGTRSFYASGPGSWALGGLRAVNRYLNPDQVAANQFGEQAETAKNRAQAENQRKNFIDTMIKSLPNLRGAERDEAMQALAAVLPAGARERFMGADAGGQNTILRAASSNAGEAAMKEARRQRMADAQQIEVLNQQIKQKGNEGQDASEEITKRNELLGETRRLMEDIDQLEDPEGYDARRQQVLNFLKERKDLLEGIMRVTEQLPAIGEEGGVLAQRSGLQAQSRAVGQAIADLANSPMGQGASAERATTELRNMQESIRAQLESITNGPALDLARLMDDRRIASERGAGFASEAGLVGHTEMERLINRGGAIDSEVTRLQGNPHRTDMESARLLELQRQQYENRVAMGRRTEELPFLMEQNRRESQRNFNRETLFAGPQELLARLGVMRMMHANGGRGATPGQFMAMSPEARRMYDELQGGDEGARLREEYRLAHPTDRHGRPLRGTALTPEQEAQLGHGAQTGMEETRRGMEGPMERIQRQLALSQAQEQATVRHMNATAAAAHQINALARAATTTTQQIAALGSAAADAARLLRSAAGGGSRGGGTQPNPQAQGQAVGSIVGMAP